MNIYVGNLSYNLSEVDLRDQFAAFGEVESARIITDYDTGRSKGFGFVIMPDDSNALEAINSLNGTNLDGRDLKVNEARERQARY